MVSIYCKHNTPRLQYVVQHIFGSMLGLQYTITTDADEFAAISAARINYSTANFNDDFQIIPSGLLSETGIRPQEPEPGEWEGHPTLFVTAGKDVPFDIFSAVFYLLSRYEEYTDKERDLHDRFTAEQSLAYKRGFLENPVINIWVQKLGARLASRFGLTIEKKPFRVVPTLDIDQAFYFRYKGWLRTAGGIAKQLLKGNIAASIVRLLVALGLKKDPNDVFEWLEQLHKELGATPVYFFHVGDKGRHDNPTSFTHRAFRGIVKRLAQTNRVGVHPSYPSYKDIAAIKREKQRLESVSGQPVTISRQHYLRFSLPETYRYLIDAGITADYTMGFADRAGYRAGTSSPFLWYDLEREQTTGLTVYPFILMDVSLKNYMQLTPPQARKEIKKLFVWPMKYGGEVHILWHNESLSEFGEWKGWSEVYKWMLTFGKNGN